MESGESVFSFFVLSRAPPPPPHPSMLCSEFGAFVAGYATGCDRVSSDLLTARVMCAESAMRVSE
jgi:hypothetical protein